MNCQCVQQNIQQAIIKRQIQLTTPIDNVTRDTLQQEIALLEKCRVHTCKPNLESMLEQLQDIVIDLDYLESWEEEKRKQMKRERSELFQSLFEKLQLFSLS